MILESPNVKRLSNNLSNKIMFHSKNFSCVSQGCGRISLSSALLLFKCVHGEQFSLDTWNRFVSSRLTSYDDVSFDEIKLWLCEVPTGDVLHEVDFDNERENLEHQGCEKLYKDWSVLQKLQVNYGSRFCKSRCNLTS